MILTVQQKFMLTAIQSLGCVREAQLVTLFRPAFCAERPALLRFTVQEQKVRRFVVATYEEELTDLQLGPYDRVILLFDAQGQAQPLCVSNKQFFCRAAGEWDPPLFAADGG